MEVYPDCKLKLIWNKYRIIVPRSVDRVNGTYAEKTQYIQESAQDLTESLMEATDNNVDAWKGQGGGMEVNDDMLDSHVLKLTYWIVCGDLMPDEAVIENEDDGLTFKYKGYEVQTYGDYVTKCKIPHIDI